MVLPDRIELLLTAAFVLKSLINFVSPKLCVYQLRKQLSRGDQS
ncbi:hypothetical protein ACVILH_002117 [Bradyrhizobium sp. USDA 4353]